MNKTKIEYCDYTWNVITGCKRGCPYCYARKMFTRFYKSFEPTFHPERLGEPLKLNKPAKVFVCSVSDLFAPWTPIEWREEVLGIIGAAPAYVTFQLLTKSPERIPKDYDFGKNVWVGTTVTCREEENRICEIAKVKAEVRFISFEPLLEAMSPDLQGIDWIIIGRLTGARGSFHSYWVKILINAARAYEIPVFVKNNVQWPVKLQEFPNGEDISAETK